MRKILIVDDDRTILEILASRFKRRNFETFTAGSAMEAMEQAGKSNFDLLILDMNLGGQSGTTVMERIRRSENRIIPVVFMSGFSYEDVEETLQDQSCCDFVEKPLDFQALLEKVDSLLAREECRSAPL